MSDTSAGMKIRRDMDASSAVEELSRSRSFIRLQAERGAMAGKYICANSIRPYVLIIFSILQNYKKRMTPPKFSSRKRALSCNKFQQVAIRALLPQKDLHFSEKNAYICTIKIKSGKRSAEVDGRNRILII